MNFLPVPQTGNYFYKTYKQNHKYKNYFLCRQEHDVSRSAHKIEDFLKKFTDDIPESVIHKPEKEEILKDTTHYPVAKYREHTAAQAPEATMSDLKNCRYLREYKPRKIVYHWLDLEAMKMSLSMKMSLRDVSFWNVKGYYNTKLR